MSVFYGCGRSFGYVYGGSGGMYQGLTEDETFMLREITAMGYPPRAWWSNAEIVS